MSKMQDKILVIGGAGYIGSHVVLDLIDSGRKVHVLDNFSYGHKDFVDGIEYTEGSLGDEKLLNKLFSEHKFSGVFHFAAFAYVGESVTDPAKYYENNVSATITLLNCMLKHKINNFIFSSTCATYGNPQNIPIDENHSQNPINPYGQTKLMIEKVLSDYEKAYGLHHVIFRYFNAAGADPQSRRGERHDPETHLIPLVLETASGKRPHISVFGDDYKTKDGTCIRDYIHVNDLSQAHILGLKYLHDNKKSEVFNLGNGNGFSVLEIIEVCKNVTGKDIAVKMAPRRDGDPPELIGEAKKAKETLGWKPKYDDLEKIIETAWNWLKKDWA